MVFDDNDVFEAALHDGKPRGHLFTDMLQQKIGARDCHLCCSRPARHNEFSIKNGVQCCLLAQPCCLPWALAFGLA